MVLRHLLARAPTTEILRKLIRKFYVDNFVHSVNTPTEALTVFNAITNRLSSAKFNLRDWVTNDQTVSNAIPLSVQKSWPEEGEREISILGILWSIDKDTIKCQINNDLPNVCTKHNLLRFLASIYDPLGLWVPCTVDLKVLLQQCWKNKYQWHDDLPNQYRSDWIRIRRELSNIVELSIPRWLWSTVNDGTYSLHVFCDASKKAYACCAYLCINNEVSNETDSALIYAKARLAPKNLSEKIQRESKQNSVSKPLDTLSIPRLELMAVVIGKRCAEFILQPFVQNCINEIRKTKDITVKHVPTDENPADYASRGKTPSTLHTSALWWKGPEWLGFPSIWPSPPPNVNDYKASPSIVNTHNLAIEAQPISIWLTDELEKRFSSWDSLINVYYYRLKYIYHMAKKNFPIDRMEGKRKAEQFLIFEIQQKYLYKHIAIIKKGAKPITSLDFFIDSNNLVRCQGRLGHSKFPWEVKNSILMPNNSFAVDLYVHKLLQENHHIGVSHTLSKLRERFWIVKGRAKIKYVLHRCVPCRRWSGGSYKLPPMAPLPEIRLNALAPFVHVGADYFGPVRCLDLAKQEIDVQVLLFTCLVTRAIHLELVPNLSGHHCFLAIQRFTALRRVPQIIITDNATTFTFVQPLVGNKVKITDFQVNKFIDNNKIAWHFIPQYAPWYGGAYERLNALVKNSLKRSYGQALLDYEELRTVLTLVADTTNSRPLTYVSSEEPIQILTPNHFLKLGPTNINVDIGEPISHLTKTSTGQELHKNYENISRVLDGYWDAFCNLYLLSLREVHRAQHRKIKGQSTFLPAIGDVVLIREPSQPRANWPLGKIEQLDRRQALAHVRCKGQILLRSILHLYPLEVVRPNELQPANTNVINSNQTPGSSPTTSNIPIVPRTPNLPIIPSST